MTYEPVPMHSCTRAANGASTLVSLADSITVTAMKWEARRKQELVAQRDVLSRLRPKPKPGSRARSAGICATCGMPYKIGARIATSFDGTTRLRHHNTCVRTTPVAPVGGRKKPARATRPPAARVPKSACQALTAAGQPCRGAAKKGELYCGPHLDERARQQLDARPSRPSPNQRTR